VELNGRPKGGGHDTEENIMYTNNQIMDARHTDRLRHAERARLAAAVKASARSARRTRIPARSTTATPAGRLVQAIFLRFAA
jgi:hypothetical protein